MSDPTSSYRELRASLVRLAYENPGPMREALLPLLKEPAKTANSYVGTPTPELRKATVAVQEMLRAAEYDGPDPEFSPRGLAIEQRRAMDALKWMMKGQRNLRHGVEELLSALWSVSSHLSEQR